MNRQIIAVCLACSAIGFALGRFMMPSVQNPDLGESNDQPFSHRGSGGGMSVGASIRRHGEIIDHVWSGATIPEESELVTIPVSVIWELARNSGLHTTNQTLFTPEDQIVKLLSISSAEKARLQSHWIKVSETIRGVEASTAVANEREDGTIEIVVPPQNELREEIQADFANQVDATLGADRGAAFRACKNLGRAFSRGAAGLTCNVGSEAIGDGRWRFRITLNDERGNRVIVGDTIPNEMRHLTDAAGIVPNMDHANE